MTGSIKARIFNYLRLLDPERLRRSAEPIRQKPEEKVNFCAKGNWIQAPKFFYGEGKRFVSTRAQTNKASLFETPEFIYRMTFCLLPSALCLLHSLTVVSVAATPQTAQVNSRISINRPTLKVGSQGESVSELQAALKLLGFYTGAVDGVYNNMTASAVSRFKQSVGLNPNGIVDASTWQQLFPSDSTVASSVSSPNSASKFPVPSKTPNTTKVVNPSPDPKPGTRNTTATSRGANPTNPQPKPATPNTTTNSQKTPVKQSSPSSSQSTTHTEQNPAIQYTSEGLPILRVGMHGPEVVKLQQRLQKLGFFEGGIDGNFGAKTEAAVKAAQQRYGMEADGVVGGGTWEVIRRRH